MRAVSRAMAVAGLAGALVVAGAGLARADTRPSVTVDPGRAGTTVGPEDVVVVSVRPSGEGVTDIRVRSGPVEVGLLLPAVQAAGEPLDPPPTGGG